MILEMVPDMKQQKRNARLGMGHAAAHAYLAKGAFGPLGTPAAQRP
jgi:hypothetical protein